MILSAGPVTNPETSQNPEKILSHFIAINLTEQQEPRCPESAWKSHKVDSLVQAADINSLTLGKEAAVAINLKEDEQRNK